MDKLNKLEPIDISQMLETEERIKKEMQRHEIERYESWLEWTKKIPHLRFEKEWKVQIIPPFGGAIARFIVENTSGKRCSIYLDVFDKLGYVGEPYWEVYDFETEPEIFLMEDTDGLLDYIKELLK
jgi:hypothetical protein